MKLAGAGFSGFPEGTVRFLRGIAKNNSKEWFELHRRDYERFYVEPAKAFVSELGPRLQRISPAVGFEAKVNGSIFRSRSGTHQRLAAQSSRRGVISSRGLSWVAVLWRLSPKGRHEG